MDRLSWLDGLALDRLGRPAAPVATIPLDECVDAGRSEVAALAAEVRAAPMVTLGVATAPLPEALRPLLEALTLTLAPPGALGTRHVVEVPEPQDELRRLTGLIAARPQASIALNQVLRQTAGLPTYPAFAAEAATYSMLLSGSEFHAWLDAHPPTRRGEPADRPLRLEREGGRLDITLADPARRNAFSVALREELYAALELAALDDTVHEVVLRGEGQVFCSGGDLTEFGTATDLVAAYLVRLDRGPWRLLDSVRARTTVHLQGAAVGAGLELAAFADRVVSTRDARVWLPELEMGLIPGAGGTVSVVRRIGRWRTAWLALTGDHLDAETALAWGLVDELDD